MTEIEATEAARELAWRMERLAELFARPMTNREAIASHKSECSDLLEQLGGYVVTL